MRGSKSFQRNRFLPLLPRTTRGLLSLPAYHLCTVQRKKDTTTRQEALEVASLIQENHEDSSSSKQRTISYCTGTHRNEFTTSQKHLHQDRTTVPLWWPWLPTSHPMKKATVNTSKGRKILTFKEILCFGYGEVGKLVEWQDNFQSHWEQGGVTARLTSLPPKVHRFNNSKALWLCDVMVWGVTWSPWSWKTLIPKM